jgi:hypothetical protein
MQMPFGKFRGRELREVPLLYLWFVVGLDLREPLASAVQNELLRRYREDDTGFLPRSAA